MTTERTWYITRSPGRQPLVTLSDGAPFFETIKVSLMETDKPTLTLELSVEDGEPVLDRLVVERLPGPDSNRHGGPQITATDVHKIKLESLLRDAIRAVVQTAASEAGREDVAAATESALQTRTRRPLTDSLLQQVANVARANPGDPTRQVSEQLYTSHRNATRWIKEAKARGFLASDNEETN